MNNPFLDNKRTRLIYISIWILLSGIQMLTLYLYSTQNWMFTLADSSISSIVLACFILILWYPVNYNRMTLNTKLFILFHALLATILLLCWQGMSYLLTNIITQSDPIYQNFIISSLFLRCVFGIFIYIATVLLYYLLITHNELKEKTKTEENQNSEILTRISVKRRQEIKVIPVADIVYIEADGDYVQLHTANDRFIKEKTMKYWEEHLPSDHFVRIHRSYIINVNCISKIEIYEKESYRVYLNGNICLKASATGYKLLKQTVQI